MEDVPQPFQPFQNPQALLGPPGPPPQPLTLLLPNREGLKPSHHLGGFSSESLVSPASVFTEFFLLRFFCKYFLSPELRHALSVCIKLCPIGLMRLRHRGMG